MSKMIFVNLPVKDLARSREFFGKLGFTFNEEMCDQNAAAMVIDEENGIFTMLLVEPFFQTFTTKDVADATKTTEATVALGVESRAAVDELADKALAAGGEAVREPMDEGFMYGRAVYDLDGHLWEFMWMDPAAAPGKQS
ncbi:glyoxalase [Streptomyces armeniacus]|uniref:Glyoxalase n=1 Tax=Streptomyces armeniacus TaxID=83291 RepID=A0A345XTJ1_9ACTN|nr:VOC family protein [Streptomyces armeniacus]AXK34957.1 glyoxalase [Streptomyces armeniacus]